MARWRRAAFATCLLWPLAACDNPVAISQADLSTVADHPTLIQPGEKVRVTVFGEANVSGDFDVDPQGYIVVPLAGRVKAQVTLHRGCRGQQHHVDQHQSAGGDRQRAQLRQPDSKKAPGR